MEDTEAQALYTFVVAKEGLIEILAQPQTKISTAFVGRCAPRTLVHEPPKTDSEVAFPASTPLFMKQAGYTTTSSESFCNRRLCIA